MIEQTTPSSLSSASALRLAAVRAARANPAGAVAPSEERLPFSVRLVRNAADLDKAVSIRHAAYGRHVPDLAAKLREPEATDFEDGVVVLLAESKLDGTPLGTMRIQTNEFRPLDLEESVQLPPWLQNGTLAEAARLGITGDRIGNMVKTVLFKAYFMYCQQAGIDWMVITARAPIDRQYERLMFTDVYPGMGYVPIRCTNDIPHRVMCLEVAAVEPRWGAAQHPLFNFFFRTHHPDLELGQADASAASAARRAHEMPRGVMYS